MARQYQLLPHIIRILSLAGLAMTLCVSCSSTTPTHKDGILGAFYHTMTKDQEAHAAPIEDKAEADAPVSESATRTASEPEAETPVAKQDASRVESDVDSKQVAEVSGSKTMNAFWGDTGVKAGNPLLKDRRYPKTSFIYRLSAGDLLNTSFFRKPPSGKITEYTIGFLDVLTIVIEGEHLLSEDVTVRMDGKISFFLIEDVQAQGRTISELRGDLQEAIAKTIPSARLSVFLKEGSRLVEDFLAQARSAAGPWSTVAVRPDGKINLPVVGDIDAAGKTVAELIKDAGDLYDKAFNGSIAVELALVTSKPNTAIMGEVRNPGMYPVYEPMHPIFALALAGGELPTANLCKAILLKRLPDGNLDHYVLNLEADDLALAANEPPVLIEPQDILVLPKTGVAHLNKWVHQFIRQNLPVPGSAGASYSVTD